jgi:hypothetical protein
VVPALQLSVAQLLVQTSNMLFKVHQILRLRQDLILNVLCHHLSFVIDLSDLLVQIGGIFEALLQLLDHLFGVLSSLLFSLELALQ